MNYSCVIKRDSAWINQATTTSYQGIDVSQFEGIWNDTFTTTFKSFRTSLWNITSTNLNACSFDEIIESSSSDLTTRKASSGWIVLPIDDDDWYANDIKTQIDTPTEPYVRWPYVVTYFDKLMRFEGSWDPAWYEFQTNNYAIVTPFTHNIDEWSVSQAAGSDVQYINQQLSCHNRTIASLSTYLYTCRDSNIPEPYGDGPTQLKSNLIKMWNQSQDDITYWINSVQTTNPSDIATFTGAWYYSLVTQVRDLTANLVLK